MKVMIKYILGAAVVFAGWYFLLSGPLAAEYRKTQQDLIESRSELEDFNRTISAFPSFLKTQSQLEEFRYRMNSRLYAKDDILNLLRQIGAEAEQRGLTVTEITPPIMELLELNQIAPDGQPEFLNISLKLEGPYVSFGRFVEFVETAEFFRGINECEIYVLKDQSFQTGYRLDFRAMLRGSVDRA
ncbi:MAG: hypothetical protein ABIE70_06380 [bacterium]